MSLMGLLSKQAGNWAIENINRNMIEVILVTILFSLACVQKNPWPKA